MTSLLTKAVGGIGCAVLALPVLGAITVAALLSSTTPDSGLAGSLGTHSLADIPPHMLALYRRAAPQCPGLSWTIPAAIGKIESNHGRHPTMVSSAGAVGPMQFLPSTFKTYAYPVPPGGKKPPTPWDPADAVYAAVRLLCANGAKNGHNLHRAIWHYNHSDAYIEQVLKTADGYAAAAAVAFAQAQLGTPYVWGGDGPAEGGFDCSGLTQTAYRSVGITIPRVAQAQFDHGPHVRDGSHPAPGDLLFFGSGPQHITHVSLYIGHGKAIDAPHPGAVVRQGPARTNSPSFQGATRPTTRGAAR